MAETATVPEEAPAGRRLPIRLLVAVAAVLAALGAAYVLVLAPEGGEGQPAEPPAPTYSEEGGEALVVDAGTTMSVGGDETRRYAMLTYSVRPSVDADAEAVPMEFPLMRSMVQRLLLGYDADELLTPEGVDRLEQDVAGVVEEIWPHGEIVDVYVENIVVQ